MLPMETRSVSLSYPRCMFHGLSRQACQNLALPPPSLCRTIITSPSGTRVLQHATTVLERPQLQLEARPDLSRCHAVL